MWSALGEAAQLLATDEADLLAADHGTRLGEADDGLRLLQEVHSEHQVRRGVCN